MAESVTRLLHRWAGGDSEALEDLAPLVHAELRRIAATRLSRERRGHTLSPTELIAEAYLRLMDPTPRAFASRAHFLAVAARQMRSILIDRARRRNAGKRGAGGAQITLDDELLATDRPCELVALDDALQALARFDERKARCVELRYFGGMTQPEIAEVLGVHENTVARELRLAEAWLRRELAGSGA